MESTTSKPYFERDAESTSPLFDGALRYLYQLPAKQDNTANDFQFDGHHIAEKEFQKMIEKCFDPVFKHIEEGVIASIRLDEVIVSGGAPTSNQRIQEMVKALLERCTETNESDFEVQFLEPDRIDSRRDRARPACLDLILGA